MKGSLSVIFNKERNQWEVVVPKSLPQQQMLNIQKYVLSVEKDRILSLPKSDKREMMEKAYDILLKQGIKQILYSSTKETILI